MTKQTWRVGKVERRSAAVLLLVWMLVVMPFAITTMQTSAAVHRADVPATAPARSTGGSLQSSTGRFNPIVDSFIALAVLGTVVAVVVTRRRAGSTRVVDPL